MAGKVVIICDTDNDVYCLEFDFPEEKMEEAMLKLRDHYFNVNQKFPALDSPTWFQIMRIYTDNIIPGMKSIRKADGYKKETNYIIIERMIMFTMMYKLDSKGILDIINFMYNNKK